ncbi:DNA replication ATP-dependent helicase/nuclease Dna2 [Nematocida ausubeli]|nr:DNA replication ATP-dependent helicase/nuclease Dna2 [Nematocida ausubeli]
MTIGWESKKSPEISRIKIEMEDGTDDFTFWEGVEPPGSPLTSDVPLSEAREVLQFSVVSVARTEKYDRVAGANGEVAYIYGSWREGTPRIGNMISIMPCLCCPRTVPADLSSVTDESNYLIVHSKKSLVTTNIIEALSCVRKAILLEKILPFTREVTKPLVHGIVVHEWLDLLVKNRNSSISAAANDLKSIISQHAFEFYKIQQSLKSAFSDIFRHFGTLTDFVRHLEYTKAEESRTVHSQLLQLKGKPDVVVVSNSMETEIELKTGERLHMENLAQVILYGLLQREQKGYTSQKLFHLKSNSLKEIFLKHFEVVHILSRRNRMVQKAKLPKRQEIPHCTTCSQKTACLAAAEIEKAVIKNNEENKTLPETKNITIECTSNLNRKKKYNPEIRKRQRVEIIKEGNPTDLKEEPENKENSNLLKDENEEIYDNLTYSPGTIDSLLNLDLSNLGLFGYIWEQIQKEEELSQEPVFLALIETWDNNYLKVHMKEEAAATLCNNEYITVYDKDACAFGQGVVSLVHAGTVEIHLHERLVYAHNGSILISKDSGLRAFAELRTSLLRLFISEKVKSMWFNPTSKIKGTIPSEFAAEFLALNSDQQKALFSALQSTPYALIHGMPGTGKTRVIALLTKIQARLGKTVLLSCHTHLSLTNIEKRLEGLGFIRMYRTGRTKIQTLLIDRDLSKRFDAFQEYNVILATSRSLHVDPIFDGRTFDMCIVDEATQQNFLCTVLPSLYSQALVLVGDHLQLSPLAKTPCLGVSLFDILRRRHDMCALTMQYRMPAQIMAISNELFYSGRMVCMVSEEGSAEFCDLTGATLAEIQDMVCSVPENSQILCYFNEQVRKVRFFGRDAETVDRFQGSEADHIVLLIDVLLESTPRLEILSSPERLNVALTRSKKKLTILGREKYLKEIAVFSPLFRSVRIERTNK